MRNRKWMICLASALVLCGCGKKEEEAPVPSAQAADPPAVSTEPAVNTPDAPVPETPEPEPELITLEEFRESNEAVTGTDLFGVHILELNSGDKHIYGQLYLPTEDKESYPLVIISHGIQGSYYDLVDQAGKCVDAGMAAYIFDYCGGSTYSRSSGDISDMSILTECDDLEFVLNELWQYAFMDRENTYLMGESQGGMVSALLAAERPQDIAGMVLLYPAFNIPDMAREVYVEGQIPAAFDGYELAYRIPEVTRYPISSLVGTPDVKPASADTAVVRDYTSQSYYIGRKPTSEQGDEFAENMYDTAVAYCKFVTRDGTRYSITSRLYPGTNFYDFVSTFDNSWVTDHDSIQFENVKVYDLLPFGDTAFIGTISFDYKLIADDVTGTYSQAYQMFFVFLGPQIMIMAQYTKFFITGKMFLDPITGIMGIWLFPIVLILPLSAFICHKIYKKTNNPYIGGIIMGIIACILTVTNTLTG